MTLWIVDFPLFKYDEDEKRWAAMHHPFTMAFTIPSTSSDTDPAAVLRRRTTSS